MDLYSYKMLTLSYPERILYTFITKVFSEKDSEIAGTIVINENIIESLDIEDVRQSQQGDHEAYKRLVEKYQQNIAKIMWRFSRDSIVHEELVQDVFVEAYFSLMTYNYRAPFIHWLSKIATRVGYRYWKEQKKQKRTSFTLQDWDENYFRKPEHIKSEYAAQLLHKMLEQLPLRDRLVLTLRFLENCNVEQTAYRTGWSKSMVKVQTIRAKSKLKKLLKNSLKGENDE